MKKYLKIVIVLILAFVIADLSSKNVFIAGTPRINPFLIARINNLFSPGSTATPSNIASNQPVGSQTGVIKQTDLPQQVVQALNTPLKPVSKGVYAGEKNNIKVYEFRQDEIDWVEYTFMVNGKEIKIKAPKGQKSPTQEDIELIYK